MINKIDKNVIRFEREETFKGNQFLNFRYVTALGLIGYLIYGIFSWSERQILTVWLAISWSALIVFVFSATSWTLHYFGLTKDYLIIRNHNFLWKVKIYRLSDIREVVFEQHWQYANSMVVITKDFRNKSYPAAPLRNKTWLELKRRLEDKGIKVRNELLIW